MRKMHYIAAIERRGNTLFSVGHRHQDLSQEHIMTRNLVAFAAALGVSGLFFALTLA